VNRIERRLKFGIDVAQHLIRGFGHGGVDVGVWRDRVHFERLVRAIDRLEYVVDRAIHHGHRARGDAGVVLGDDRLGGIAERGVPVLDDVVSRRSGGRAEQ
jgi:hypothetical protein